MKSYDLSDPKIRANPDLLASLETARPILDEAIGESAGLVDARWRLDSDPKGRPLLHLKIWDDNRKEGAERAFAPDELNSADHLDRRFHHLWLALLFNDYSRSVDELVAMKDAIAS